MNVPVSIGVAGWSYPDWRGIVYPPGIKNELSYLSGYIDCLEINNSFYRIPLAKYAQAWLKQVSSRRDFFFTAKLHSSFTHDLTIDVKTADAFKDGLKPLLEADKLKHLLMQFKYDFEDTPGNREHLRYLTDLFRINSNIVLELRHKSWMSHESLVFLEQLQVTLANLDYPVGANSFDLQTAIGQIGYFRLHGRNKEKWFSKSSRDETYNYYYNSQELTEITDRTKKLLNSYPALVIIANNHYRGAQVANALELKYALTGRKPAIPESLMLVYPHLKEIANNPKTSLF
ncbi:MAG: DUF72 domain-containing protein [Lentisphaerae bacterium]|nr:DUF72 domain-containing protein [Lentisphaerota bacterium]